MADRINIKSLLNRYNLGPKRSWSQNFLVDIGVLEQIVQAVELSETDVVVELGAGLGALTSMLAREAHKVVAVERDRDLAAVLRKEFVGDDKVQIMEANAATLDWQALVEQLGCSPVVVGNLPYHMASKILFHMIENSGLLSRWLFMFQREMAQRIVAGEGGRDFGVLSVMVQMQVDAESVMDIPPSAFHPQPRVHSQVVRFIPLNEMRFKVRDQVLFKEMVRAVFQKRRKMIRNGLKAAYGSRIDSEQIDQALEESGISPSQRAEQLSIETLARLSDALSMRLQA